MTFHAADISVVIPSYNSRDTIVACLESLRRQEQAPGEIIMVDSANDGAAALVISLFPEVTVRHIKRRIFPGPARNLGASLAQGKIFAFIDADCVAHPSWLARLVAGHNQGHQVVGGAVEVGNPANPVAWAGHLGEFREFLPFGSARPVLHIPTCNISYRRELFSAAGGFPDAYYPQEDLLFNYLLNQQGVKIWFDPQVRVRHIFREELAAFLSHQHRIGRVTRSTLNRIPLPGWQIARHTWLAWLAAPLLGIVKFLRNSWTMIARFPRLLLRFPELFLVLFLGSIWWARGFAASARTGLSGIRGWDDPDEPIFARLVSPAHTPERK